jgi:outer membrane protein OmpA-like peptidoglycan-associated protein
LILSKKIYIILPITIFTADTIQYTFIKKELAMKFPRPYQAIVPILILFFFFNSSLEAQTDRDYFYLMGQIGTTSYHGDLSSVNKDKHPMFDLGFSGGVGYVISPRLSVRAEYRRGEYPRTDRPEAGEYFRRHTTGLYATIGFLEDSKIRPYLLGGLGMTYYGTYDKDTQERDSTTFFKPSFGPSIGLGFDYSISELFSVFVENKWDFILDDKAMDEISGNAGFDRLGYISAGLRINIRSTFIPIPGIRLTGPTTLIEGDEGNYTASLLGPATEPVAFEWDFGDGTRKSGVSVNHVYTTPGRYVVTAVASNTGSQMERTLNVIVDKRPVPAAILSAAVSKTEPEVEETIRFSAEISGTDPISVEWDFGDGTRANQLTAQHKYTEAGKYTATLRVENIEVAGDAGVDTRTFSISVPEPEILLDLEAALGFALNSAELLPGASVELDKAIEILEADRTISLVEVAGHTCDLGAAEYNQRLSELRANAVTTYLIQKGIDPNRLVIVGYGGDQPRVPNVSEENRRLNRRVIITVRERNL